MLKMGGQRPYITEARRRREGVYRGRIALALFMSAAFHVSLAFTIRALRERIPLMRHIGYEGPVRILAEVSVLRELGLSEYELAQAAGRSPKSFYRVSATEITDAGYPTDVSVGDVAEGVGAGSGEGRAEQPSISPPQPTTQDLVLIRLVKPVYPESSIKAGVEGVVVFRLRITRGGNVAALWLLSSETDRACERAAERALREWRFRPYLLEGEPIDVFVDQRVRFRLVGGDSGAAPTDAPGRAP